MSLVTTTVINYKQVVNCLWYDNSVGDGDSDSDSIVIRTLCGMAVGCCNFFFKCCISLHGSSPNIQIIFSLLCITITVYSLSTSTAYEGCFCTIESVIISNTVVILLHKLCSFTLLVNYKYVSV